MRLTVWYALSVLLVLVASSLAALALVRVVLVRDALRTVGGSAAAVADLVAGVPTDGARPLASDLDAPSLLVVPQAAGEWAQIENLAGGVVAHSSGLGTGRLPIPANPAQPAQGVRAAVAGRAALAWVSVPLHRNGLLVGALQVAEPLAAADHFLAVARRVLVWVDLGGACLAGAVGWLLADRALAPVRGIIAAAQRIDAGSLEARLPEAGPPDEIREIAHVINQALERIAGSVRAQQQFVAMASHELRTPLAIIQGYADVARRWQDQEAQITDEAAAAIREEASRLRRMTDALLLLAREGRLDRPRENLDLAELARGVYETMLVLARGRTLLLDAPQAVPVAGDPEALQQIAVILLDNALKYTSPGGHIALRVAGGGPATLVVEDDGPGIPPAHLPRLFDPFFRGDEARSRAPDGFGLGLSIARLLARAHGGEIRVETGPGRGSRFTLILPRAAPAAAAAR